jgi:lysophospholipase L1-like esterase
LRTWAWRLGLTVALLAALEGVFRLAGIPWLEGYKLILKPDPVLVRRNWPSLRLKLYPRQVPVTVNAMGFRGRETSVAKPAGCYRVIALGDSSTFGVLVGDDETYCSLLEGMLNADPGKGPGRTFEVINAGVIGYTTRQGLIYLQRDLLRYSPDCIVVSFAVNDTVQDTTIPASEELARGENRLQALLVGALNSAYRASNVCRLAIELGMDIKGKLGSTALGVRLAGTVSRGTTARPITKEEYAGNLRELARLAREQGMYLVYLPMPVRLKLPPPKAYEPSQAVKDTSSGRRALAEAGGALARAREPGEKAAINFFMGRMHEKLGEGGKALGSYLEAMSYGEYPQDLRWRAYQYLDIMGEVASREKAAIVNLLPVFYARELSDDPPGLYGDAYHPGPLGHRLLARALCPVILEKARNR